ncbi:putative glycolipid-binding domain-containing protein [Caballeronia sp. LZ062]|uniref:putative glycolipid-binding domain-containing protein n=1 Tax=unclassified Caballeronia TaxID=2646786 RepID=UPI00285434FB|nr:MULTISPECIES: putative glycolipid-binding domain-containing protein [unclassified Caballeronia]MDR5857390.1 putative glycolipid-binding domain-containing protein [Caballeronia sp. LZ050]MDR5868941.1 putative glycolipid-binding domain-containing protein [Caballeronia sp. LZ062]
MKHVRWSQRDGAGLEHLVLDSRADGVVIESVIVGEGDAGAFGMTYRIECDARWQVTRLAVKLAGGASIELLREEQWTDEHGAPQDALRGCIDVDIIATPFTNTLPIRRLNLQPGERREIRVVYVRVPEMTVSAVAQAYTCLERNRRYRFEGLDTGFDADITVDEDGLVTDYPGLFERIA